MHRDTDAFAGPKPALIALAPVRARRAIVVEVRVNVDQQAPLSLLRLLGVGRSPAESGTRLILHVQIEIGLPDDLFLKGSILVIDIIEIVDGWFPG